MPEVPFCQRGLGINVRIAQLLWLAKLLMGRCSDRAIAVGGGSGDGTAGFGGGGALEKDGGFGGEGGNAQGGYGGGGHLLRCQNLAQYGIFVCGW